MVGKEYRIIPALDTVDLDAALRLVCKVAGRGSVHGFKLGFALGLTPWNSALKLGLHHGWTLLMLVLTPPGPQQLPQRPP